MGKKGGNGEIVNVFLVKIEPAQPKEDDEKSYRQDKAFERRFVIVELSEPTEVKQISGRREVRVSFCPKTWKNRSFPFTLLVQTCTSLR